jgi:hypothetical protein
MERQNISSGTKMGAAGEVFTGVKIGKDRKRLASRRRS